MSTIINVGFEPFGQSKSALFIAEIETSNDLSVMIKMETSTQQHNQEMMSVQMSTPPPSAPKDHTDVIGGLSPSEKDPATFKDAAEAKRARRSAIEKKSRQRRQNILKRMREEVKRLENTYADMIKMKEAGVTGLVQWRGLNDLYSVNADELQQKYSELTLVVHALEQDHAALQKLLQEHENFNRIVRGLSDERRAEDAFAIWDSGVPPSSSFAAKFRPLSMTEGYAFVRESYEEIRRFTESESYQTTGASFMGWTDKRKFDPNSQALQYSSTKQFPFENTENVFMKSWNTFLDGPKLENLAFDHSVQSRFEVLQVLNNDLLVIRRDHRIPRYPMTFTTVQIMFRLQTPMGYTLCVRTISSPEIQNALKPHEFIIDVFHWTHFNRLYNEYDEPAGREIVTVGSIGDQNRLNSNYWLFELVCSVLRWESTTIAPLFLLQT